MIGLDTNVLVRLATQDDSAQAARVDQLINSLSAQRPGYVSTVVVAELHWVLKRSYHQPPEVINATIRGLLASDEVVVQDAHLVARALVGSAKGLDFADALIGEHALHAGCRATVTFDRAAAEHPGFELLET